MARNRKTREGRKRKQAMSAGLPANTNHRSHVSGTKRFLRTWVMRQHAQELKEWEKKHGNQGKMLY